MACAADSKFSNRHVTFESNSYRDVRFKSNLEASQVPTNYSINQQVTVIVGVNYFCNGDYAHTFPFSAVPLLVGRQEGHLACKS